MAYPCGRGPKLLNLLVMFMLYLNSSPAQSWNPLEESDVLKTYRLGNHIQCQRLCWYRKLCARYSFSYTNGDNPEGSTDNCVLHAKGDVPQGQLMEGWISQLASEDYMAESHPCKPRSCGDREICLPGFNGQHTCLKAEEHTDMNDCASSPCVNNATCHDLINEYNCTCAPGFNGTNCETDMNECASSPCKNNATCHDLINEYSCTCAPGFNGTICETDINDCASSPCVNNATCHDLINEYSCTCAPGFTGTNCEIDINECASHPCLNNGACNDAVASYTCVCAAGYTGDNCQTDVRTCLSGWTRFRVSCYKFQPNLIPYNQAKSQCEAMNSYLAEIESLEENNFITNLTAATTASSGLSYIGVNDMATEGVFVLTSSGRVPSYTYWKSGQPDNWDHNEDCVAVAIPGSNFYPGWNDIPCGSTSTSSVCECSL